MNLSTLGYFASTSFLESIFSVAKRVLVNKHHINEDLIEALIITKVMGYIKKRQELVQAREDHNDEQIFKELGLDKEVAV